MYKRVLTLSMVIVLLFTAVIGRLSFVSVFRTYTVSEGYNSYSVVIDTIEPNLYYSNGGKINNNKKRDVALIKPNPKDLSEISKLFDYNEQRSIREELKSGYPIIKQVDKQIDTRHIKFFEQTYSDNTLNQFVNISSSGLLDYTNSIVGKKKLVFSIDALGRMLQGDEGKIVEENYNSKEGYKLSTNSRIQQALVDSCVTLDSGCAVIMDVSTGDILASVTKPVDSYMNKAIQKYPVGSVYKLVVASCAIENNVDLSYNCVGSILVGDTIFSCQRKHSHGFQSIKEALANSCNCYFVNLALHLGKDKITKTAQGLGFYDDTELFSDWIVENANMPTANELDSLGELALLGFGQGKLLSTPLQICSALCTISTGKYTKPHFVIGEVNSLGKISYYDLIKDNQVLKTTTSKTMLEYMRYVVSNGTGYLANDKADKAAGKTATAETGQYKYGREINNTWFAGVYPYVNPRYAIVIMKEDGKSGAEDCCPIFRTVVEKLYNL